MEFYGNEDDGGTQLWRHRVWRVFFRTERSTAGTLILLCALLLVGPLLWQAAARERNLNDFTWLFKTVTVKPDVRAKVTVKPDIRAKYQLNYAVRAPHYMHSNSTSCIDVFLVTDRESRDGCDIVTATERSPHPTPYPASSAPAIPTRTSASVNPDEDQRLFDVLFDSPVGVSQTDAEIEAPSFTVIRMTPQGRDIYYSWRFFIAPKSGVDGLQSFVYRVRIFDKRNREVSYTAGSGTIDVGTSPFTVDRISVVVGIVSGIFGVYLQLTKARTEG